MKNMYFYIVILTQLFCLKRQRFLTFKFIISIIENIYFDIDIVSIINLKSPTLMPSSDLIIDFRRKILIYSYSIYSALSNGLIKTLLPGVLVSVSSFLHLVFSQYILSWSKLSVLPLLFPVSKFNRNNVNNRDILNH